MNLKLTKKRQLILNTLKRAGNAVSAKEIHVQLPTIDLTTIYRTLELLTQEKIVTALHFDVSETKYEYQTHPHHHAVCTTCEKVIHFEAENKKIKQLLDLNEFTIDEMEITVRGTCKHN